MEPAKHVMTMTTLDLASSFADGHWTLPPDVQAVRFFLQENGEQHGQGTASAPGLERSSSGNGPIQALLCHRRKEPHCPSAPRYGQAACAGPLPDRWKPKSGLGRAGPRASGARSRPDNRTVCVRGWRPHGRRLRCRLAARTRAHSPVPSSLPESHSASAHAILAACCRQGCAASGCFCVRS